MISRGPFRDAGAVAIGNSGESEFDQSECRVRAEFPDFGWLAQEKFRNGNFSFEVG